MTASVENDAFFRFVRDRGLLSAPDVERCRQICQQTDLKSENTKALTDLDHALEIAPNHPKAWSLRGNAHTALGM